MINMLDPGVQRVNVVLTVALAPPPPPSHIPELTNCATVLDKLSDYVACWWKFVLIISTCNYTRS